MHIGLTGGIACGKSTAAKIFARHGCDVVSTDQIAHDVLATAPIQATLRAHFGAAIFAPTGAVDRTALGKIVFDNPAEKTWLESIVHPAIRQTWKTHLAQSTRAIAVVEIPLLFEKNLETDFDLTVSIHCTHQVQWTRMAMRGLDVNQAEKRLNSQWPLEEKMRRSHHCLFNEGNVSFLERQILLLLSRIAPESPNTNSFFDYDRRRHPGQQP